MIEHVWSVFCQNSVIDGSTNTISLFNAIEQIRLNKTLEGKSKAIDMPNVIFSLFSRSNDCSPCAGKVKYELVNPDNKIMKGVEYPVDLSDVQYQRIRVRSERFPIASPGVYRFIVSLLQEGSKSWRKVASIPILLSYEPEDALKNIG